MASILKREIKFFAYVSIELERKFSLPHFPMKICPFKLDVAAIERRDSAFESRRSRDGIEPSSGPWPR
jgi:hypothetical protein